MSQIDQLETYRAASGSDPASQTVRVPLLNYPRFVDDPALRSHIVDLEEYYQDLAHGTLPAVAYVASSGASELLTAFSAKQDWIQEIDRTTSFHAPRWSRLLVKRSPNVGIDSNSMVMNGSDPSLLS